VSSQALSIACVQLKAHDRSSFADIWREVLDRTQAAAAQGAQLIVLPEGTIPGYVMGEDPYDGGMTERALDDACSLARSRSTVLVVGAIRSAGGKLFNSAVVIDADGSIAGIADKQFLWGFDRQWFSPGERIEPISTAVGRLGALICGDVRIPTIPATLVEKGAEMLVMPTAWVTSGRDPSTLESALADFVVRVRAKENGVPFAAANKCGSERGCVAYCGKSQIVDANGSTLKLASQHLPQTITATVLQGARAPHVQADLSIAAVCPVSTKHRVGFTAKANVEAHDQRLAMLDCDTFIGAGGQWSGAVSTAYIGDDVALNPHGLIRYRRAGYQIVVWESELDPTWLMAIARTRAMELRMYIVVLGRRDSRALVADVHGNIVAGTFDDYTLACFTFDGALSLETTVAPGTDILKGFERAEATC
jgi:predicted amidohydrolase